MNDDSTTPENDFSIPADPGVIDGDEDDADQAALNDYTATEDNAA